MITNDPTNKCMFSFLLVSSICRSWKYVLGLGSKIPHIHSLSLFLSFFFSFLFSGFSIFLIFNVTIPWCYQSLVYCSVYIHPHLVMSSLKLLNVNMLLTSKSESVFFYFSTLMFSISILTCLKLNS